ncbi:MAG: hypothetical protein Q4E34_00885 [Synergistaceae bacterium]|nr:hypothetical protein [Synergistaceae bacterium]
MLVILANFGDKHFAIEVGDRIAQIVFAEVTKADVARCDVLDDTDRSGGGLVNTGRRQFAAEIFLSRQRSFFVLCRDYLCVIRVVRLCECYLSVSDRSICLPEENTDSSFAFVQSGEDAMLSFVKSVS